MRPFWRAKKNRWILPYLDAARVQRQHVIPAETAPTKRHRREAEEYARGWLERQKETGAVPPLRRAGEGPTVRELRDRWMKLRRASKIDSRPRYKPATIAGYEDHLDSRILKPFGGDTVAIGDVPLSALDVQRARAWTRKLAAEVSPYRARNIYSTLRSLIDDAIAEGWVKLVQNPLLNSAVLRELPEGRRTTGPRPIVIELDHVQKVIDCVDVPEIRRVRTLVDATSGLSEGELAGRVWADLDLELVAITVNTSLALCGPAGWATIGTPKNEHRVRTIPLHSAAAEALQWWKDEGWANYVGRPPKPTDPIFPGPRGNFTRPAAATHLRRDLKTSGCPTTCHGHPVTAQALRRCFSSFLDAEGVSEEVRGRLMGHAAKSVTAKHYTAAALERDRAEVEKIPLRWVSPRLVAPAADATVPVVLEAAPVLAPPVPIPVPVPVPAAQEAAESIAPPARIGLATFGLGRRTSNVPKLTESVNDSSILHVPVGPTFGATCTIGHGSVPNAPRSCADPVPVGEVAPAPRPGLVRARPRVRDAHRLAAGTRERGR